MLLNAGSGAHYVPGWVNVDVDGDHRADIHADLADLPLPDASVERIFVAHVLEHLEYFDQVPRVLSELRRVLVADGELCIVGPDIERAVILGEQAARLRAIVAWPVEFNTGAWKAMTPPTGHAWTATSAFVERALHDAKLHYESYSGRLHQLPAMGWPLENFGDWQNGYVCHKESQTHVD